MINNYLHKSQTIINNHKIIKNSQRWYLLGRTSGGFCDVDLHFVVVVILHLLMFFIHIFFSTSSLTLLWTAARFLDSFYTSSPAMAEWFATLSFFNHSVIFLPRVLRFWVGIFYPKALYTLHSFPTFSHNLLLSRFHWEPAVTFLKVAGLHTDPRNTDPVHLFVWFTVIHNLLYILALYLCISILPKFYLWWKLW